MPVPHQLTIEVLDAFGGVAGTAVVQWADVQWSAGSIDEVHRVFAEPVRLIVPPARNDARMAWGLSVKLAGA